MKIVVDTREQMPFQFYMFECRAVSGTIPTGDYSLAGLVDRCAVERKSLDDFLGCLTGEGRERFEQELARARGLDAFAVVGEKNKAYNIATPEAMAEKRQKAIDPRSERRDAFQSQRREEVRQIKAEIDARGRRTDAGGKHE